MAKRVTKAETTLILVLVVIGLPIYLVAKLFESVGPGLPVAILIGAPIVILIARAFLRQRRRASLMARYQDANVVDRIMGKIIWQGETTAQLRESLGDPPDIDEKVLKSTRREIWKYAQKSRTRFGLKITVENGIVVGWDEKL